MEELFNKLIEAKIDIQSLASFFQNDFEGPCPEYVIEDFDESVDNFIRNINNLKAEGIELLKNKK